jgi:hypothetical protein
LFKVGNPVYIYYFHNEDGNHFRLENLEIGSAAQAREILGKMRNFKKLLKFHQKQGGGMPRGTRTQRAARKYNKIMNLRNSAAFRGLSDEEFLKKNPDYSQSALSRAKKWYRDGRIGLHIKK